MTCRPLGDIGHPKHSRRSPCSPAPGCRLQQTSLAGRPPSAHSTLDTVTLTLWYWVPTPMASWTPPPSLSRNRAETQGADLPWASLSDSPQGTNRLWILSSLFGRIQELHWVLSSSVPDTVEKVGKWGAAPQPQRLSTFTHNSTPAPSTAPPPAVIITGATTSVFVYIRYKGICC